MSSRKRQHAPTSSPSHRRKRRLPGSGQTDFTYLKVLGWGWFYLSTILDDYSRYIISWKLCTTMKAEDVTATLDLALEASGCDSATVITKPRLLSDNGSSYIAADLAEYLDEKGMDHVRGAPYHPQTQGKIERWHQTMKNRVLLEHYFLPPSRTCCACAAGQRVISNARSTPSSNITIDSGTMRASAT